MVKFLTDEFIAQFPDHPEEMSPLGQFVFYRTYSRRVRSEGRRETYKEMCRRSIEYNVGLEYQHLLTIGYEPDIPKMQAEAEKLFHKMFHLKQFLSGRTMWVGGADTGVAEKFPLANFNCSFLNITKWDDLGDLFYLLLVGTGVGFRCSKKMASNLPPIRTNVKLESSEYNPLPKNQRLEHTKLTILDNGYAKIYVGDSKEGWVEALRVFFKLLTDLKHVDVHSIKINYNSIRPKGEPLLTFGGTASGHESLKEMFEGIDRVLKNKVDPFLAPITIVDDEHKFGKVRPIHILDIGNLIGNNVVVGGVRRTAEIFLCDPDDFECIWAKYGINGFRKEEHFQNHERVKKFLKQHPVVEIPSWFDELGKRYYDETVNTDWSTGEPLREKDGSLSPYNFSRQIFHRAMSNNSVLFEKKPSKDMLAFLFEMMRGEGEPGFANLEAALKRAPNRKGFNPCAEILLDSYGVCNLTTVNVAGFVKDGKLEQAELLEAIRLSARAGVRMTLVTLELPHWDAIQKRDRLIGPSLTGFYDAMDAIGAGIFQQKQLLKLLREEVDSAAREYCRELRIPEPLLTTTIKPEGTLSQVAGGVSSGLHRSHAPYYIRRIRINADDALAKAVRKLGWPMNPENGTPGNTWEERMENARMYVIDFPVKSSARVTKSDITIRDQFDTYFMFQEYYTSHNSSNTITVKPHEWVEALDIVWKNWNNFVAVSFLAEDGGTYQLAPYETITEAQYNELVAKIKPFDPIILKEFDSDSTIFDVGFDGCENGICPVN